MLSPKTSPKTFEALTAHLTALELELAETQAAKARAITQARVLTAELTLAEERERRRLAQLLHDHLQQLIVAAKLRLSVLELHGDESVRETARLVDRLLADCVAASRALAAELSPPLLHDAGLGAALEWLARKMRDQHGLEVTIQGDLALNPRAADVRTVLFQSTREQLFNVVKHAGVRAACVTLSRLDRERIVVEVGDDGCGFVNEASADRGSGLRHIAERLALLDGSLELESAPGRGTRVRLIAPLGAEPEVPIPPSQRSPRRIEAKGSRIRVLLVDDNDLVRRGLIDLLARSDAFEVVGEAEDGQAALDRALALEPDLVLMDVNMPRLDGIEATRLLKQLLPELTIVGLSLRGEPEMESRMRQAGASAHVTKDERPEALLTAILEAVVAC